MASYSIHFTCLESNNAFRGLFGHKFIITVYKAFASFINLSALRPLEVTFFLGVITCSLLRRFEVLEECTASMFKLNTERPHCGVFLYFLLGRMSIFETSMSSGCEY